MQDEHVDDKRGVVDLRFGSVVIYSTGALHSLWNIPAHSHMTPKPPVRTSVCSWAHCPVTDGSTSHFTDVGNLADKWVDKALFFAEDCDGLPGPAQQRRHAAGECHHPGETHSNDGVLLSKTERCHWLTHHNITLDSQNHKRPQRDLTWQTWKSHWSLQIQTYCLLIVHKIVYIWTWYKQVRFAILYISLCVSICMCQL